MTQFRLPDQVPVSWARIDQSGEGGTNAARIDGSGTSVYNYLMHTVLLPAPSNVSLQTRLRAKLINMTVGNASYEGAAVLHRGFKMTGAEPNLKLDTQVWSSNPQLGGRKYWISGNTPDFQDYNFLTPIPDGLGIDYVTFELVVRSVGQIIVSNAECRHYYGKLYEMDVSGTQSWETDGALTAAVFSGGASGGASHYRYIRYLKTIDIVCRQGQSLISTAEGTIGGMSSFVEFLGGGPVSSTVGFSLKLRRKGSSAEDWFDVVQQEIMVTSSDSTSSEPFRRYDESRQKRARYDYDRVQLVVYIIPHGGAGIGQVVSDRVYYTEPTLDLIVADFVAPSQ